MNIAGSRVKTLCCSKVLTDGRTTYTYNGEGKRLTKVNSSGTIKYLYDQAKVAIERDVSNNNLATYTHEGGGLFYDLISVERSNSDYWYLFDGLGSVTEMVDSNEDTQNSYRYEAFGQIKSSSENVTNYYKYVGAFGVHHDSALALYFMQARYYKASIGRFITMDPMRGAPQVPPSLHRYLYIANNPVNYVDASGLLSPPVPYIWCMNKCYSLCKDICEAINLTVPVIHIDCFVSCRDACDAICDIIFPGYCGPPWEPGAWQPHVPTEWCHGISGALCLIAGLTPIQHLACHAADWFYCEWLEEHPPDPFW